MFGKLRNKFLMLNMIITSMVMVAAFAVIYFITYNNIHSEIRDKLNLQPEMQITIEGNDPPENMERGGNTVASQNFPLDGPPSFSIDVDKYGKILKVNSFIDIPDGVYYKAAEAAWNNKKSSSVIILEGKQWRYNIVPINIHTIKENGQQVTSDENGFTIIFLDVTSYNKTLLELFTTLLSVGLIMIFVIFIISRFFANRAIKPISAAWEKQKQFVADASHELKTPLSIINANYDALLANQEETIKSQIKWLQYIKVGTDRMTKLINDLLSLARIESTDLQIQKVPFNISDTIINVISSMEAVMVEKGIKLSHSIEPDITVKSDPERIRQVVTILFDNAIKYANENGQIDVSLKKTKHQVIYSIRNSGKGIVKQDLPKIFDRFYRTDPSRTHENGGYGLGLSIAKTIMDRLDGDIYVTSVENEYTTFTFTLRL